MFQLEPSTPQNLEELVEESDKIPILTLSSNLKNDVIPDLVTDETLTTRKKETYNRLRNVAHFPSNFPLIVAQNLSTQGFVLYPNATKVSVGTLGLFAVVEGFNYFKLFGKCVTLFGKYKPSRSHNSMSFFTLRAFWIVRKNFFANIFATGLTSLVESGIYQRWKKHARITKLEMIFIAVFREMQASSNESMDSGWRDAGYEPTSLEQVTVPLVIFLGMLLGSLAVFGVELYLKFRVLLWARITCVFRKFWQSFRSLFKGTLTRNKVTRFPTPVYTLIVVKGISIKD